MKPLKIAVNIPQISRHKKLNEYRGDYVEFLCKTLFGQNGFVVFKTKLKDENHNEFLNSELLTYLSDSEPEFKEFLEKFRTADDLKGLPDFVAHRTSKGLFLIECKTDALIDGAVSKNISIDQRDKLMRINDAGFNVLVFRCKTRFIQRQDKKNKPVTDIQNDGVIIEAVETDVRKSQLPELPNAQPTLDSF